MDRETLAKAMDAVIDALGSPSPKCPGCGRPELHKLCPAWGTPKYMTGELFTEEDERTYSKERQDASGELD